MVGPESSADTSMVEGRDGAVAGSRRGVGPQVIEERAYRGAATSITYSSRGGRTVVMGW